MFFIVLSLVNKIINNCFTKKIGCTRLAIDRSAISYFVKIRISNSILNIEKGRHLKIPVEQRICPLCKQEIEDEYHFVMKYQNLDELRNKFFDEIISVIPQFSAMKNTEKLNYILSSQDLDISKILVISVFNMYCNLNKPLKGMQCNIYPLVLS